jgi:glutamate-1-semialdehyde 2,1-aminomutase
VGHSGTFNGNPVTSAAGLKVLELLDDAAYEHLDRTAALLEQGLVDAIERTGIAAHVTRVGSIGNVHFTGELPRDYDGVEAGDRDAAAAYHLGLLNRGISIAPRGMWATSVVTQEADVQAFVDASAELFAELAR